MKSKQKIALIEDDTDIRDMYKLKLNLSGYEVVTADDGVKAMSLIKKEKPDLVLLDILLPRKDGFEILKEVKQCVDKKLSSIPFIIISNLSTEEDMREAKSLGAYDFLVKAKSNPNSMIEIIDRFFEKK